MMRGLRILLVLDSAVLSLLGLLFIFAPKQVALAFKFENLPDGVDYIIGLLGCVFATMAIGYLVAATNPIRHTVWVQVGIARGALECVFGLVCVMRGIVTFSQAGFGIIVAGLIAVAYAVLYPREEIHPTEEDEGTKDEG
jgi:hypothetical protein